LAKVLASGVAKKLATALAALLALLTPENPPAGITNIYSAVWYNTL
jgi:hypothetical protein